MFSTLHRLSLSVCGAIVVLLGVANVSNAGECQPAWVPTFGERPGVNDTVEAMVVFDDGSGGGEELYVAGDFTLAGGETVNRIAKWDGQQWSDVGGGMNGTVRALAVYDDGTGAALYAGGSFQSVGGNTIEALAKWNGTTWSAVGDAFIHGGFVWSLKVFDDGTGGGPELYVGGFFTEVGGTVPANRIAKWNGTNWSAMGGGMTSGPGGQVRAMEVYDDGSGAGPQLYAAGSFLEADGVTVNRIAKWNHVTETWSGVGDGFNTHVWDLAVFDDGAGGGPALYAAGEFRFSGATSVERIAKWDVVASAWKEVAGGLTGTGTVLGRSMVVYNDGSGDALHVGGQFSMAGGNPATSFAKFNGTSWSALGVGMNGLVTELTIYDDGSGDAIFAGGSYIGLGTGLIVDRMLKWDGIDWHAVGPGLTHSVRALEVFDDGQGDGPALYAGGLFVSGDGEPLLRIAKWNGGTSWTPLGSGVTGGTTVNDIAVFDDGSGSGPQLYIVGNVTTVGGVSVSRIAKWDHVAQTWSNVGGGFNSTAWDMEVWDDGSGGGPALYVAGQFITAGGVTVNRIAKWDGTNWTALGTGLNNTATLLIVHDDGTGSALYTAGGFTTADGVTVNRFAKWDGANWSGLGDPVPGVPALVTALGIYDDGTGSGDALYVSFDATQTSNGVTVNRIAKWDGTNWSPLGDGLNHTAGDMAVYDDGGPDAPALFVGGAFIEAGGQVVNYIARWNGSNWQPMNGGGLSGIVSALCVFDDGIENGKSLFVGGSFDNSPAGDSFLAKYTGCAEPIVGDLDGNGAVDVFDLFMLLSAWGDCAKPCPPSCPADLTNATGDGTDCTVDVFDLFVLLSNWG